MALRSATVEPKVTARDGVEGRARGGRKGGTAARGKRAGGGPKQRARDGAPEAGRSGASKHEAGRTTEEEREGENPESELVFVGQIRGHRVCKAASFSRSMCKGQRGSARGMGVTGLFKEDEGTMYLSEP